MTGAARDLDDFIDYIALDNPPAAEKVYRAIVAAAERLQDFPEIGHAGRLPAISFAYLWDAAMSSY
jgi:toxin ParE1/3/4